MEPTLSAPRVRVLSLSDLDQFLTFAEQLKGLTLLLRNREARESRLQASLRQQIASKTRLCMDMAERDQQLAARWGEVQSELAGIRPTER